MAIHLETLKQWITIVTKVLAATAVVAGAGYGFGYGRGSVDAEGQFAREAAGLDLENSKLQLQIAESVKHNEQSQQTISARDNEIGRLTGELGRSSKCMFVQKQIRATEEQIELQKPPMRSMMIGDAASADSDNMRFKRWREQTIVPLEERFARYQEQLGTCDH